ncbi:MAG: zinc ABC transporter substrate-binding protein [Planctomycetales bacterium]|nr:zinc ABC transporter substrate-binding protein [Planctomycetales bacterium]
MMRLVGAVCALSLLAAASTGAAEPPKVIVCSTTQIADFARQVVGDRCEVKCVLAPGQDPHTFRPTANDVRLVASADLCFENGWHLEGHDWMRKLAADAGKPIVSCVTGVEPVLLDVADATQPIRDPHAWFAPKNAAIYVRNILSAVKQLEPQHADEFTARSELYLDELRTLHLWATRQVGAIEPNQRVLVTSHDAFHYFCATYGFRPEAPAGWSTAQELGAGVTFDSRKATVESIRRHGVKSIFVETSVNPKLVEEIADEAGVSIAGALYSDSMGPPGSAGETYLGMMRENVLTIVQGLK